MEHRRLGRTGLQVSWLGLGTMTWSRDTDEHDARDLLHDFVDAGGTLVDTSASYAEGGAEELLGTLLGDVVDRRDLVLVTKGGVRRTADGAVVDASRGALLDGLDGSLERLGTDHVDLWLVQTPDPRTPLEETASALRRKGRNRCGPPRGAFRPRPPRRTAPAHAASTGCRPARRRSSTAA